MTLATLIRRLSAAGILLRMEGDRLAWSGPKGAMTDELRETVVRAKGHLIAFLRRGPYSPARCTLRAELAARPWIPEDQYAATIALFEWHADTPADEKRALSIALSNVRLWDRRNNHG